MSGLDVKMLHDRILVKVEEHNTKTPGGLLMPDTVKPALVGTFRFGEVVAVGPGLTHPDYEGGIKPMGVKVGDRVCFHDGAANEVRLGNQVYANLGNDNVQMVVPEGMDCSQVVLVRESAR